MVRLASKHDMMRRIEALEYENKRLKATCANYGRIVDRFHKAAWSLIREVNAKAHLHQAVYDKAALLKDAMGDDQ
ncbi:MAG: hypothetical protein V3U60_16135 [Gammaproteobacteria bacterium]